MGRTQRKDNENIDKGRKSSTNIPPLGQGRKGRDGVKTRCTWEGEGERERRVQGQCFLRQFKGTDEGREEATEGGRGKRRERGLEFGVKKRKKIEKGKSRKKNNIKRNKEQNGERGKAK